MVMKRGRRLAESLSLSELPPLSHDSTDGSDSPTASCSSSRSSMAVVCSSSSSPSPSRLALHLGSSPSQVAMSSTFLTTTTNVDSSYSNAHFSHHGSGSGKNNNNNNNNSHNKRRREKRTASSPAVVLMLLYSTGIFTLMLMYTEVYLWRISALSDLPGGLLPLNMTGNSLSRQKNASSALVAVVGGSLGGISSSAAEDEGDTADDKADDDLEEKDEEDDDDEEEKEPPLVHIIHSRFMQSQPHLVELGRARLMLLRVVFLKSLSRQTSDNFVLVVKTDPDLDLELKQGLIHGLQESKLPHVLLASNESPKSIYHELKLLGAKDNHNNTEIWSGSLSDVLEHLHLLPQKEVEDEDQDDLDADGAADYALSPPRVLETRLDADDGLHVMFVEMLQAQAAAKYDFAPLTWRIWCIGNHAEWQYHSLWPDKNDPKKKDDVGSLVALQASYCVTAGLTIGFLGDLSSIDTMPSTQKHERLQHLPMCTDQDIVDKHRKENANDEVDTKGANRLVMEVDGSGSSESNGTTSATKDADDSSVSENCRSFLPLNFAAIRARTPTSAGMLNVVYNGTSFNQQYLKGARHQRDVQDKLWYAVKHLFGGFSKTQAKSIHQYFDSHMREIAKENLEGQCTRGHSCKNSSQILLKSIAEGTALVKK